MASRSVACLGLLLSVLTITSAAVLRTKRQAGCGGRFTDLNGQITSPGWPAEYQNNQLCTYSIEVPPQYTIGLKFRDVDIEHVRGCVFDNVTIYDGGSTSSPLLGKKICGTTLPDRRQSSGNKVTIVFQTDYSAIRKGFRLQYTAQTKSGQSGRSDTEPELGSTQIPDPQPETHRPNWYPTQSPNYGQETHRPNGYTTQHPGYGQETWNQNGYPTQFPDPEPESWYDHGYPTQNPSYGQDSWYQNGYPTQYPESEPENWYDHGYPTQYNSYGQDNWYGHGYPTQYPESEPENWLDNGYPTPETSLDDVYSTQYPDYGPITDCGGSFTTESGEITSPGWPSDYKNNLYCIYSIEAPPDNKILLNFTAFDIEQAPGCHYDYLKIYDGSHTMSSLMTWWEPIPTLAKKCGQKIPEAKVSPGNVLTLLFASDSSITGKGFKLYFSSGPDLEPSNWESEEETAYPEAEPEQSTEYPTQYPDGSEEPGIATDSPTQTDEPEQPTDSPTQTDEPGQPTDSPTHTDEPEQPTDGPTQTDEPGQPTDSPTQTDEPEQPTDGPTQSDEPEQPTDGPTQTDEPEQPTDGPTQTGGTAQPPVSPPQIPGGLDQPEQSTEFTTVAEMVEY